MAKKEEKKAVHKKAGKVEKKPVKKAEAVKAEKKEAHAEHGEEKVEKKLVQKLEAKEQAKPKQEGRASAKFAGAEELRKKGIDSSIIFYPLITEKAVGMIESQNKLCFIVSEKATKTIVKKTIQEMYGVKVDGVNIVRDMKARKKAIVKLNKRFKADEIAMKLGVI